MFFSLLASLFLLTQLLTQSASAEPCKVLVDQPDAAVSQCGALKLVRLSGDPVSRAKKMGELVRQGPLSSDVVQYFSGKVSELLDEQAGPVGGAISLAYNQVVRLLHRMTPTEIAEEVDAMALGLKVDPIVLRRGLSLPDTGALLQGLGSHPWLEFLPPLGCTSVAAPLKDGGFAYGRNLDFAGVGTFDRNPMLLSIEPGPGSNELRHLVIGADGLLYGGITGVNEAGIAFAIHQNFSRDVGFRGVPMIFIGELVLRSARTLEEAEEILRKLRPASVWTFVVADLNRGEMMAVESSRKHFLTRRSEGGFFAQTNHHMHEESRELENGDLGVLSNSIHRMKQAFAMLEHTDEKHAALAATTPLIAKILSYQENKEGKFSGYHDVLKAETIQTAIFEAKPGQPKKLYVSVGEAPSAAGLYAAVNIGDFWKKDLPKEVQIVDLTQTPIHKRVAQREISLAYHTYFDKRQPLEAASILEGHPTLAAGLFRTLAFYQAGRWQEALALAERTLNDPRFLAEPVYIQQSLENLRLLSFWRLGRKEDAHRLASQLLEKGPAKKPLQRLCQHIVQGRAPPEWMLRPPFNFFSGDLGGRKD